MYLNDGTEIKKKVTFDHGDATFKTDVSVNRDLSIKQVGVSIPPK